MTQLGAEPSGPCITHLNEGGLSRCSQDPEGPEPWSRLLASPGTLRSVPPPAPRLLRAIARSMPFCVCRLCDGPAAHAALPWDTGGWMCHLMWFWLLVILPTQPCKCWNNRQALPCQASG